MLSLEEMFLRLVLSILAGGIIGAEREYVSKAAGFRTLILISLGSTMFTIFSQTITEGSDDRIASNIVTGIGFLGAGVIFKEDNRVKGLTTAASVWATAAIGMGIGAGFYMIAMIGSFVVLFSLIILVYLENWIEKVNQSRLYRVVMHFELDNLYRIEDQLLEHGLKFKRNKQSRIDDSLVGTWFVSGPERAHRSFIRQVLQNPNVKEFDF
jgi:putative Mg2+ transporter-C (MgtC) family protein